MSPKPISEKQLAANRRNAQNSTGPRSAAGKQTVSLNAVRHGLAGNVAVLSSEDRSAHDAFCSEVIEELAPVGAIELNLAQSIVNDLWRLNRVCAIETNMLALGYIEADHDPAHDALMQAALAGARTFMNHVNKFVLLSLYEQRINRSVHRNRALLAQMQAERREARRAALERAATELMTERAAAHPEPSAATRPPAIPLNDLRLPTPPNGFVYSNRFSGAIHPASHGEPDLRGNSALVAAA